MSKILVCYKTKYGAIEKYAKWISEELSSDIISYDELKIKDILNYDIIIYGGGVHAGGIRGFDTFSKVIKRYKDTKKFVIFTCGMNVQNSDARSELRDVNFSKKYLKDLTCFFFDGDYNPNNIKGIDKKIMNFTRKILVSKGELNFTPDEKELLNRIDNGFSNVTKEQITRLITYVREEL